MAEADINYAKGRSDELFKQYEQMMADKKVRDEEQAFQDMLERKWTQVAEMWTAYDNI